MNSWRDFDRVQSRVRPCLFRRAIQRADQMSGELALCLKLVGRPAELDPDKAAPRWAQSYQAPAGDN